MKYVPAILVVALVLVFVGLVSRGMFESKPPAAATSTLDEGDRYQAKRVRVISGDLFDVYLENGKRYLVKLAGVISTPPEAKDAVIRLLNQSQQDGHPLVVEIRRWDDDKGRWIADLYFDGTDVTLAEWLQAKTLVYSR